MFSGVDGASSWAADASESAGYLVEVALGQYSSGLVAEWSPSDEFDEAEAVSSVPDHPNVSTDGSLVLDRITGVSSSGSGFFAHQCENCWRVTLMEFVLVEQLCLVRVFALSLGPLQSVQRAEMWGVILALQSSAVHVGIDNLGVVRHVGRLLDGHHGSVSFELVKDGDLVLLIGRMLRL